MASAICKDPAFIFIHIPKTGGTSFISHGSRATRELKRHCKLEVSASHRRIIDIAKTHNLDDYFKFSVVRNPYDRFISLWLTRKAKDGTDLDGFIELIENKRLPMMRFKPQVYWISDGDGSNLLVDHLVKYENYKLGLYEVLRKLKLPFVKLPHMRQTMRDEDYRKYYKTQEQIEYVKDRYKIDLLKLGYRY